MLIGTTLNFTMSQGSLGLSIELRPTDLGDEFVAFVTPITDVPVASTGAITGFILFMAVPHDGSVETGGTFSVRRQGIR